MRFTLYTADCCGNKQNKIYPHEVTITSPADMKKSCRFDHVCARYTDGIRGNDNFMTANVIPMDCDNDCSETDFITAEVHRRITSGLDWNNSPDTHFIICRPLIAVGRIHIISAPQYFGERFVCVYADSRFAQKLST